VPTLNFQSESVSAYSVEAFKAFSHVGRSHRQVDPGRRSESNHGFRSPQAPQRREERFGIKILPHFDRRPLASTTSRCDALTDTYKQPLPATLLLSPVSGCLDMQRGTADPALAKIHVAEDEYLVCPRCEASIKMLVIEGDPGYIIGADPDGTPSCFPSRVVLSHTLENYRRLSGIPYSGKSESGSAANRTGF